MEKYRKPKKLLLFVGLISLIVFFAATLLLFLLRYDFLWTWYADLREMLLRIEYYITSLDKTSYFIAAILALYLIKSIFPIYPTSTVCFLTGVVFPIYIGLPVNLLGLAIQFTVKYFWGRRFGAGYAWKLVSKNDDLRTLIQSDGKGNPILLALLRMVPWMPVNTFSSIYGSFDFGYPKYLGISLAAFLPKLISFCLVGNNLFDPLSAGFLIPVMVISLFTAISGLSVNGVWNLIEQLVREYDKSKAEKEKG
ncbi:MAG: VTT domain-containing protein [Clostridia bacterium]|nr:VTT domain-containing protein [Clostridia bacterium]